MISKSQFKDTPPITLFYLIVIVVMSILPEIYDKTILLKIIKLDYKKVIKKYEIWRLITTYFYIGKFSTKYFFKLILYYRRMKSTENIYKKKKNYSEFIMMLIYLMIIIHITNFIGFYYFNFKINSFLSYQLMFSIILVNSKREPNKTFRYYFIPIENRYVPYFLFSLRVAKNSDKIIKHIVSFIPGLAYFWLKFVGPRMGLIDDILITPKFLVDFLEENSKKKKKTNKKKDNINNRKINDKNNENKKNKENNNEINRNLEPNNNAYSNRN